MRILNRLASRFTARGRALATVAMGRVCAKKGEPENANKYYTEVVNGLESHRDVIAMALFNRALVLSTIGKETDATKDLETILSMPEAIATVKKSARDKLVRMRRKLERESSSTSNA